MADIMCNDNRFEVIGRAKEHLLEATNIDTSPDEMKVLDSFLFRCWQMGWLDRYDDKADAIMPMTLENAINFLDKIGWLAEHDRIISTSQWTPCKERPPEKSGKYLASFSWKLQPELITVECVQFSEWTGFEDVWGWEVIAWAPLPKPYKGERKDDE